MVLLPTVRSCEIVSRLKNDEGETLFDIDTLPQKLAEKSHIIRDYAYIIHDRDTYTEADESVNPKHKSGTFKPEHIHLYLRFKRNQPQKIKYIAKHFDIPENFISKIRGSFEDCIRYLVHDNAEDKFQYSISDVTANFNVETVIEHARNKNNLDDILQRILSGEIREYNKTLEIDNMTLVYQAKKINEAFKIRAEHLQATQTERNTTIIYIYGNSGAGKTTLAKKIATERGLDYFVSSGSRDIMDGFAGQPALICDDIRPSCLGLSDLLKMLDPHTASSVSSRYKNKYLNADLIILTSVLPIEEFYHNVFEHESEPIEQLKRRCQYYIKMNSKIISIRRWNSLTNSYSAPVNYFNDTLVQYQAEVIADTKSTQEHIENDIMPFLKGKEIKKTEIPKSLNSETKNTEINPEIITDENFIKEFHKFGEE